MPDIVATTASSASIKGTGTYASALDLSGDTDW